MIASAHTDLLRLELARRIPSRRAVAEPDRPTPAVVRVWGLRPGQRTRAVIIPEPRADQRAEVGAGVSAEPRRAASACGEELVLVRS